MPSLLQGSGSFLLPVLNQLALKLVLQAKARMKNIKFATLKTVVENSRELKVFDEGSGGRLSLKSNFVWTFVGNIVYAGCQWGILMILAKLGSPEMVGQFALGLAITAPIILFANLQIRAVQATDTRQEYSFADYLALRLFTTILALLVITGIILTLGNSLETTLTLFLIGLAKAFEAISDVFYGLLQQQERMDRIAISMIIKGLLSLAFLGLTLYFTRNLLYAVCVLAFVWALVLVVYDCRSGALTLSSLKPQASLNKWKWSSLRPRWNLKTLARLAWLSLPLGIAMSIISLNSNIPRYFIQHYFGEWELGIFAALTYLLMVGNTLVSALGQAATPRLAYYFASEDIKAFNSLLLKLVPLF
jgi:O-antigen/teichoic acid export membrane protein